MNFEDDVIHYQPQKQISTSIGKAYRDRLIELATGKPAQDYEDEY